MLIEDRKEGMSREDALQIPDSRLHVIKKTKTRGECDDGWIYCEDESIGTPGHVYVIRGPNVIVESESLSILSLATGGRMTAQKLWRTAMHEGWSLSHGTLPLVDGMRRITPSSAGWMGSITGR